MAAPTREELAEVLTALVRGEEAEPTISGHDGNAPGHAHLHPGLWDGSNKPCEWCATWAGARGLVAALQGEKSARPAKMRRPAIGDAKRLCGSLGARQVMVIAVGGGKVAGASYGETKGECATVGRTLDAIIDGLIAGRLPCPSIFERKRPLAEATLRRIAAGIRRFVVEAADPFVIPLTHHGYVGARSVREPMRTVTAAHRGELAIVNPFLAKYHGGERGHTRGQDCEEPLRTLDTSNRFALIEPFVVRHGHYSTITGAGLHEGCGAGTFRGQSLRTSLGTVCATNDKHLVCPVVIKHYGGVVGHRCDRSLGTVTAKDHHSLAAAFLTKFYGTSTGSPVQIPLPAVLAGGGRGGGHLAEVRAFLVKYYSQGGRADSGQQLSFPLGTVPTKDRFGLVTVHGEQYQIVDVGMRMLQPHELFAAQGFPDTYDITCTSTWGKPLTKTEQTALAGNSVCPGVARALVAANVGGRAVA